MNVADFTSEHARWQAVENRDARADNAFVFCGGDHRDFLSPVVPSAGRFAKTCVFTKMPAPPARRVFALQTLPAGRAAAAGAKRSVSRRPVGSWNKAIRR